MEVNTISKVLFKHCLNHCYKKPEEERPRSTPLFGHLILEAIEAAPQGSPPQSPAQIQQRSSSTSAPSTQDESEHHSSPVPTPEGPATRTRAKATILPSSSEPMQDEPSAQAPTNEEEDAQEEVQAPASPVQETAQAEPVNEREDALADLMHLPLQQQIIELARNQYMLADEISKLKSKNTSLKDIIRLQHSELQRQAALLAELCPDSPTQGGSSEPIESESAQKEADKDLDNPADLQGEHAEKKKEKEKEKGKEKVDEGEKKESAAKGKGKRKCRSPSPPRRRASSRLREMGRIGRPIVFKDGVGASAEKPFDLRDE